MSMTLGYWDIR
uniref:Uncharacterized protein n=4 Tax=Simiiformes TaxID=314293 RepID=A0A2K5PLS2_CEBIM